VELETRLELAEDHPYFPGVDTTMSIDRSLHSLFGVSKAAADLLVQEYGRYFAMRTACFRGGCLTGPNHAGARLHGFLSYLMRCAMTGEPYIVEGYGGKQVRDNVHSADLVRAFAFFHENPRTAAVYNIGGGRESNCSVLEAIALCEQIADRELAWDVSSQARRGDHMWWISDLSEFRRDYPDWRPTYDVAAILREIYEENAERWSVAA
jgi:CDP-paratose 2-epimerase